MHHAYCVEWGVKLYSLTHAYTDSYIFLNLNLEAWIMNSQFHSLVSWCSILLPIYI